MTAFRNNGGVLLNFARLARALALLVGTCGPMTATAQVNLKNSEFTLSLPADWLQVKSQDPEQWSFESAALKTSVVLSLLPKLNIPKSRLIEAGKKFAAIRKEAEQKARPGQRITYGDEWVELQPSGDVVQIAYAGYDETGMIFRFFGYVTQAKVLSFWVATSGRDNGLSKRAFDEAFRGLKFYIP